jgi:hypothetical protein
MPIARPSLLRLDRLRRSTRLAAFALLVFVLRVGIVAACAPSDLVEAFELSANPAATHAQLHDAGAAEDPTEFSGHCLHCSCHHAVTLPAAPTTPPPVALTAYADRPLQAQVSAPPDLSLRPPIV